MNTVGLQLVKGTIKLNFATNIERLRGPIPDQIEAKLTIQIGGVQNVAEFPLQIGKQELSRGYHFEFETSTTDESGFRYMVDRHIDDSIEGPIFFKVGVFLNGHVVEVLRLNKSKLLWRLLFYFVNSFM